MTVFGSRSCEFNPLVVQNKHCFQLSCLPILLFDAQNCLNLPKNSPDPTHRCTASIKVCAFFVVEVSGIDFEVDVFQIHFVSGTKAK